MRSAGKPEYHLQTMVTYSPLIGFLDDSIKHFDDSKEASNKILKMVPKPAVPIALIGVFTEKG